MNGNKTLWHWKNVIKNHWYVLFSLLTDKFESLTNARATLPTLLDKNFYGSQVDIIIYSFTNKASHFSTLVMQNVST